MTKGLVKAGALAATAGLMLLTGCQKSFDERYAEAQKKIGERAVSIDKDLAAKASEAATMPVDVPTDATAAPPPS